MSEEGNNNSRRNFITHLAGVTFASAIINSIPFLRGDLAFAEGTFSTFYPQNFPENIETKYQKFENWSGEIQIGSILTCFPKNQDEVVILVNWAKDNGYKVRAKGKMHNWSPLTVQKNEDVQKVILVDLKKYLTHVSVNKTTMPQTVTAQTGVTLEELLTQLENNGLGMTATPAPGVLTLGGVLAINGHGTAIPVLGEQIAQGHAYGSLSNLILSLNAVVWDDTLKKYFVKTFKRSDPDCSAFLTHMGRTLITEVTLQVGVNQHLRCQSRIDIPVSEVFGPPNSSPQNFSNFVDQTGRVEAILFPFTDKPWLKQWSVVEDKPRSSRHVDEPYNYPFTDSLSKGVAGTVAQAVLGNPALTPEFGHLQYEITESGLKLANAFDLYGWSKNLLLYIRPSTLRVTANGYVIMTSRSNIQRVIYEFYTQYQVLISEYEALGQYPMNGPIEIRVTGLDTTQNILTESPVSPPLLSALRPRPDHTEWDVGIWLDILTIPGTSHANEFYRDMEQWIFSNYVGSYAGVRVEWSKGWGYTAKAGWADEEILKMTVPNSYREGQNVDDNWDAAQHILTSHDPYGIFSSPLLDALDGTGG